MSSTNALEFLNLTLGIECIVQVDDAHFEARDFEMFWELAGGLPSNVWVDLDPGLADLPGESRRTEVENRWNDGKQESLAEWLSNKLISEEVNQADDAFQRPLERLFSMGPIKLELLTLAEWRKQKDGLIERAKVNRTLFLFDLNFQRERVGTQELGLELVKEVRDDDHVIVAIVTESVQRSNEAHHWRRFSKETGVGQHRFVVLSKERLSAGSIDLFVDGLRRMALASYLNVVQKKCLEALGQAFESATIEIGGINVYDFDQALVRSSRIEGVWEADTFLRLFSASLRSNAHRFLRSSEELHEAIDVLRRDFANPEDIEEPRETWKLQRQEIYEDAELINSHCLPVANGDIFKVGSRFYVLVAQPCDLMVRRNGRRAESETEDLAGMGTWLQITKVEPLERKKYETLEEALKALEDQERQILRLQRRDAVPFQMPYFNVEAPEEIWEVNVARVMPVWLAALDLCALDPSGVGRLQLKSSIPLPPHLLPSWTKRAGMLHDLFRRRYELVPPTADKASRPRYVKALFPAACIQANVRACLQGSGDEVSLTYSIQRISRLASSRAAALLGRVAAYLSRPALEHDLGREEKE